MKHIFIAALAFATACSNTSEPSQDTPPADDGMIDAGETSTPVQPIAARFTEYGELTIEFAGPASIDSVTLRDIEHDEILPVKEIRTGEREAVALLSSYQLPVAHQVEVIASGVSYSFEIPGDKTGARVAFITRAQGNGDFATWPGAAGDSALEIADAFCQNEATEAGLHGTFVAFIGDDDVDPACRIRGLSGHRSNDCNTASLSPDRGLVIGMNRRPIVAGAAGVDSGIWEGPIGHLSTGAITDAEFVRYPGDHLGENEGPNCQNWTSGGAQENGRSTADPEQRKPDGRYNLECDKVTPLACVQVGGPFFESMEPSRGAGLPAFVSSIASPGHFGAGPGESVSDAADAFCTERANAAGLGSYTWSAWISSADDDAICRLMGGSGTLAEGCGGASAPTGPWVRTDGIVLAESLTDLGDERLSAFLNRDEFGHPWTKVYTYSGSRADGTLLNYYGCNPEGPHFYASGGNVDALGNQWSNYWGGSCGGSARVHCFARP